MNETRLGAILVAAGRGARMRAAEPKQFQDLGDRKLVMYALQALASSPHVESVVVVVPAAWEERARALCSEAPLDVQRVSVVPGGATRQESVRCGLQALPPCPYVLVHDAARPFVTQAQIERVVVAAQQHGAATVALPVTDTLMRAAAPDRAAKVQSVDRQGVWAVQTPQVFERELLWQAHEHARAQGVEATDDGSLVVALGRRLELVLGSWWNIKVTTAEDLQRARWILQSGAVGGAAGGAPDVAPGDEAAGAGERSSPSGSSNAAREGGAV
jgi:2-C-methyl-D-erythritol 4-phosphate cytidylyltransferase